MPSTKLKMKYWYTFLKNYDTLATESGITDVNSDHNILNSLVQESILEETVPDVLDIGTLIPPVMTKDIEKVLETTKAIEAVNVVEAVKTAAVIRSKGDIIEYITANTGLNNYTGKQFLKYFAQVITEELAKGEDIHIINFGKFTTVTMPAKDAINPRSKEKIVVPEHKQARLRFYNEVKSKLE